MRIFFAILLIFTLLLEISSQSKRNPRGASPRLADADDILKHLTSFAGPVPYWRESIQKKFSHVYDQFSKAWAVLNGKKLLPSHIERASAERKANQQIHRPNRKRSDSISKQPSRSQGKSTAFPLPTDLNAIISRKMTGDGMRKLDDTNCNNGVWVETWIIYYMCNDTHVTPEVYNEMKNTSNCNSTEILIDGCFCPADSSGYNCEIQNSLICTTQLLAPQLNCTGNDSDTFMYGYGGIPPCVNVSIGDQVSFEISTNCTNKDPSTLQEGITISFPFIYVDKPQINFTYAINTTNLVSYAIPNLQAVVNFIDWRNIQNLTTFSYPIPPEYIINGTTQTITVPITSDVVAKLYGGRIFYEIDVTYQGAYVNQQLQMGLFDLKGYQEPPYVFHLTPGDIVGIVIGTVAAAIIIPGLVAYLISKRKKAKIEAKEVLERERDGDLLVSPQLV